MAQSCGIEELKTASNMHARRGYESQMVDDFEPKSELDKLSKYYEEHPDEVAGWIEGLRSRIDALIAAPATASAGSASLSAGAAVAPQLRT